MIFLRGNSGSNLASFSGISKGVSSHTAPGIHKLKLSTLVMLSTIRYFQQTTLPSPAKDTVGVWDWKVWDLQGRETHFAVLLIAAHFPPSSAFPAPHRAALSGERLHWGRDSHLNVISGSSKCSERELWPVNQLNYVTHFTQYRESSRVF